MARKIISILSILAVINLTTGCVVYSDDTVLLEQQVINPERTISEVILDSGETVLFNDTGGTYSVEKEEISGVDTTGTQVVVKAENVLYLKVKDVDNLASIGTTFGAFVGILAIAVIILAASSCPLVYAFDGARYVFDAEPLGGSISKGLAKTDWSRLEHLREHDGSYDLLIRNQLPETQHLDEMRLLVIDHPADSKVYPDLSGTLHAVRNIIPPAAAHNEKGEDIRRFVEEQDYTAWQSPLPRDSNSIGGDTRHHLTFTFPRPNGVTTASLLVNAGTATWGSNMIRSMLTLRGDKLDDWYADVDAGGMEKLKLGAFILREELFILKVYVKEDGEWVHRGYIPGSGPYMTEDRLCALDLSNVSGDVLEIRLDPPIGYWVIDHLAVSFEAPGEVTAQVVTASEMLDQDSRDVAPALAAKDGQYHDMPVTGQYFTARFPAPPAVPGMGRSIFLQTSGWYELHIAKDAPEQTALIQELMSKPGKIVSYSLEEFVKWRTRNVASQN